MPSAKKKSSPNYPDLGQRMLQASGDEAISKLPQGLYVVATPIGHMGDITLRALVTLASVDLVACEDTRVTGGLLNAFGIKKELISCHDHNEQERLPKLIDHIKGGGSIALTSDAGLPLIADPGYRLVQACHKNAFPVTVIPGANAALTALAGSGLGTDSFYFMGFLPPKTTARKNVLENLRSFTTTLIFYEAPQRLLATLEDAAQIFGSKRQAAVARELTKLHEEMRRGSLEELISYFSKNSPRGEIVLLIAPGEAPSSIISEHDLDILLQNALHSHSLRDAVDIVCEATGRKKNEIYARALWMAKGTKKT